VFQAPTGTRDFYPAELSRLRYVQNAWRTTSINHGFDEIDGPTFEHLDLYTVKSGEGIISELFSFERFGGEKTFALRPEFTPTLARMYASKAASLPKPTKWFWMQNCYRAERPQRGRLREFCQWNCDIIGDDSAAADAEVIACCVGALEGLGLTPAKTTLHPGGVLSFEGDVVVRVNDRRVTEALLKSAKVAEQDIGIAFALLDKKSKISPTEFAKECERISLDLPRFERACGAAIACIFHSRTRSYVTDTAQETLRELGVDLTLLYNLFDALASLGITQWCLFDPAIARGLAYYTGMVFEVHEASGAERAIAGGGRYDKLIEMFGGPPTPAVGFGMGDVVLSLVLQDKGLLPKDEEMGAKLGLNPDALVISNGSAEADGAVAGVVAELRRAGLHARRSYKTTKNIGKLIQDAAKMRARYCVILEGAEKATVKDMGTQGQEACGIGELAGRIARR
jgi:histidyl-tRNA synthetase